MIDKLMQLRKNLHQYPELSGQEFQTANRVVQFLQPFFPTQIITNLGGCGVAAIFEFSADSPVVWIRCELDALPIQETNRFSHQSKFQGISHKCGHDGHIAIVAGLAKFLSEASFQKGKVVLLFQPAEETGKGAAAILKDEKIKTFEPDYIFALHNMPGYPLHEIIWIDGQFTATVQSIAITLLGKTSHAAEPENGTNPALAISEIIQAFEGWNNNDLSAKNFALTTPVHILLGKKDYGISAGDGEVHFTMRTWSVEQMDILKKNVSNLLENICKKYHLQFQTEWIDYFPASRNDDFCNQLIRRAAQHCHFKIQERQFPFKFGEDFGWLAQRYAAAMFGLGAGENSPALHHSDYDFPDEIIPTGMAIFQNIIEMILE